MEFKALETDEQLAGIKEAKGYSVIFKHNTTCPISKGVKRELDEEIDKFPEETSLYILDLLKHRNISDAIAADFNVKHESPQLLLIKDGQCTYNEALYDINVEDTTKEILKN